MINNEQNKDKDQKYLIMYFPVKIEAKTTHTFEYLK